MEKWIRIRLVFMAFVSVIVWVCCQVAAAEPIVAETNDARFDVMERPTISIKNADGTVKVRTGGDKEVLVHVVKEVSRVKDREEARKVKVNIAQHGNRIEVETDYPRVAGKEPRVFVNIEIVAPVESDLTTDVTDGDSEVTGLHGTIEMHSADGSIHVTKSSGELRLSSTDGTVTAEDCSGSAALKSVDGNVRLFQFEGNVEAQCSDGHIVLDGLLKSVQASASDGTLDVRVAPGASMENDWSLHSTDGDVTLRVPSSFAADFDINVKDGDIHTDVPISVIGLTSRGKLRGKLGNGGFMVKITSSNGKVSITRN